MKLRDILLSLLVIVIWSGNFIAIKLGIHELPPLVLITLRFLCTTLVFLPFIKWPGREQFWKMVQVGLFMSAIHQGLLFIAMDKLEASTIVVLLQSQIMFAAVFGWLILKEAIHWRTGLGLITGFSGLLLVLDSPDASQNLWSCAIGLLSALAIAFSYIRMRQLQTVHAPTFLTIINGTSLPFVLGFSLIMSPQGWAQLPQANLLTISGVLIYQALIVSLSHVLWQTLLSRNTVTKVTCFILLLPIVTIALSILLLGESMHASLIWGGLLTVIGVGIITIRKVQKKQLLPVDPVT